MRLSFAFTMGLLIAGMGITGMARSGRGAAEASGQTQPAPATLDDVLKELRALHADLNQLSGATVRGQLLTARLSLQEQRIYALAQELAQTQRELDAAAKERSDAELRLQQLDAAVAAFSGGSAPSDTLPNQVQAVRAQAQKALADAQTREQRLRTQAAQISSVIADEQSRWNDFNNRLDDLERSLPAAR